MNGLHSRRIAVEAGNPTLTWEPQADKLSAITLEKNILHFACDLYFWLYQWCSFTLPLKSSIASFTLNKSEVKEENKGIVQQTAKNPQLHHCWSGTPTFLHHKISIKLCANRTWEHMNHGRVADIKRTVSHFRSFQCMVFAVMVRIFYN
jgi:hypothetical protein